MKHDFRPYLNPVFIETGSYIGDGIQAALNSGFTRVISIELAPYYHNMCKTRFQNDPRVHLYLGDSVEILPSILCSIGDRCTFWLDAHFCGGYTQVGIKKIPILEELRIIGTHPIKNHSILIDDMRAVQHGFLNDGWNDLTIDMIKNAALEINPEYQISFDFGVVPDDIFIAQC